MTIPTVAVMPPPLPNAYVRAASRRASSCPTYGEARHDDRGCIFRLAWTRCRTQNFGQGKPYLRLSVRVGDGDAAQWVSVLAFDAEALAMASRFVQGARVYVEGRISLTEWTGKDGAKRHGLSVMAWHCRLSQIGRNKAKRDAGVSPSNSVALPLDDPIPF